MHEVEYLIVNHSEENAKRVRKANKQTTGNPPKLSEMVSKIRRFLQVEYSMANFLQG